MVLGTGACCGREPFRARGKRPEARERSVGDGRMSVGRLCLILGGGGCFPEGTDELGIM